MGIQNLLLSALTAFAEPTPADGSVQPLTVNRDGRLRVSTKPGFFDTVSGTVNTVNAQIAADVSDASNIAIHVSNAGTVTATAGTFTFEASLDSTNGVDGRWFQIQMVRTTANTIETSWAVSGLTAGSSLGYGWEGSVNAYKWVRIRCTVAVTANASMSWILTRGSYATEPIPAAQTHSVMLPGGTGYHMISTATTNAANIRNSGGNVNEITAFNPLASPIYVKLYNKSSTPVPATDSGSNVLVATIPVAASAFVAVNFAPFGKRFGSGIGIAITGAAAANDATAIAAGVQVSLTYT